MQIVNLIVDIGRISPFVAFTINLLLGLWVFLSNKNGQKNLYFFFFSIILSVWALCCFFQSVVADEGMAIFVDKILYSGAVFAPIVLLQLTSTFTRYRRNMIILIGYIFSTFLLISNWTSYFRSGVSFNFGARYVTAPEIFWHIYVIYYVLIVTLSFYDLIVRYKCSKDAEKLRILYIFLSLFILILGGNSYFLLILRKFNPIIDSLLNLSSSILLILYSLVMSYLILKLNVMDFRTIVQKSLSYVISTALLLLPYILAINIMKYYSLSILWIAFTVVYNIIAFLLFEKIRLKIQTTSDKLFLKGKYDFTDTVAYLAEKLSYVVSLKDLEAFFENARVENIESSILKIYPVSARENEQEFLIETVDYCSKNKKIAFLSNLPKELVSGPEFKGVEFIVPCFSRGKLTAIIFVGKKLSEDPYKEEEVDVFKALAPQIAAVIERIKPYEKVKQDLSAAEDKVEKAQKEMEKISKLASLGTLAAGLAHEIRNPMMVLSSKSQMIKDKLDDKEYLLTFSRLIPEQINRILDIVNRMLRFARAKEMETGSHDVNKILEDTLYLLSDKIKSKNISAVKELSARKNVSANQSSLSEAFLNITLNALDFMESNGRLTIRTADEERFIRIEISDTGAGIPDDKIDHIFEPFFTTRAEGTGLGLSIAYKNIQDHRGRIEVNSKIGEGSVFIVHLPAVQ